MCELKVLKVILDDRMINYNCALGSHVGFLLLTVRSLFIYLCLFIYLFIYNRDNPVLIGT